MLPRYQSTVKNPKHPKKYQSERLKLMSLATPEAPQLPLNPRLTGFTPEMFILEQSVQMKLPILAQLVTWRNSVDLFREQERRDLRELYNNSDHRSVLSALIGQGEWLLHHSRLQSLRLEDVGLSEAMIESEIRSLRDNMRITHEELISDSEADQILGVFANA
jgi:hypothetical protein